MTPLTEKGFYRAQKNDAYVQFLTSAFISFGASMLDLNNVNTQVLNHESLSITTSLSLAYAVIQGLRAGFFAVKGWLSD